MKAVVTGVVVAAAAMQAGAVVNPFTETFSSPAAAWSGASAFTPLTDVGSGGPDGSGYATTDLGVTTIPVNTQLILFRGQSNFNSSGNAFVGNWQAAGVTAFTFSFRHNAPGALDVFARFAPEQGGGIVALTSPQVQPNTWTTLTVAINPANPFLIYEGTTFDVFNAIARTQVGILVPQALGNNPGSFTFDIDNVSITPAPGGAAVLAGGLLLAARRRR